MPEHHLRPTLSGQWVRPNIVGSHWHKRCILQESCINNLDHPKLRTTCSPGWLQCQSGCRQRLVALPPHQRSAVCWRRSNCNSHPERIAVTDETLLSRTLSRLSACRRQNNVMGQDMQSPHQPSPSMTTSLIPITSSCTLDQQSPITSPWTLRSIRGSERQLQHSLAPHLLCGQTSSWQWRQRWVCTMPAFLAPYMYYMAARQGPHTCMPDSKRGSAPFT